MRTAAIALSVLLAGCTAQTPPPRESLPPVGDVVDPVVTCSFGVGTGSGVFVNAIQAGSPSDGSLAAGDVLVSLDGAPLASFADLRAGLAERAPGDSIVLAVERDGDPVEVTVTLGAAEDDPDRAFMGIEATTAVDSVPLDGLGAGQVAGAYVRMVEIDDMLYRFDPVAAQFAPTGVTAPSTNWEVADGRVFWVSENGTVVDNTGGSLSAPAGTETIGLLGAVDDDLLAVWRSLEDGGISVIRLDLESGAPTWERPVDVEFSVPVGAITSPGADSMVVAFASTESSAVTAHELWRVADGAAVQEIAIDATQVLGFLSPDLLLAVTEDGELVAIDTTDGADTPIEIPVTIEAGAVVEPVGDGRYVLVRSGRDLTRADLGAFAEQREIVHNCSLGDIGRSGGDIGG